MPQIQLPASPLLPGISPVTIDYVDQGNGSPLFLLHGGWGYGLYPFNRQIQSLECGGSTPLWPAAARRRFVRKKLPPPGVESP